MLITALKISVTCEGRYFVVFLYHIRLLLHFTDGHEINFSFFLHQSLYTFSRGIQSASKKDETSIFYHSLIKILVVYELGQRKYTWEEFLAKNFPQEENQIKGRQQIISPHFKKSDKETEVPPDFVSKKENVIFQNLHLANWNIKFC